MWLAMFQIPKVIYPYFARIEIFANTVFMHDHKIKFKSAFAADIYTGTAYWAHTFINIQ
jgi:hypothetical protein